MGFKNMLAVKKNNFLSSKKRTDVESGQLRTRQRLNFAEKQLSAPNNVPETPQSSPHNIELAEEFNLPPLIPVKN